MTQRKFETKFKKILKSYSIETAKEYDRLLAKPKTNLGELNITCCDGWIAMRFEQEGFSVSKFFAKFSESEQINPHTFKWNIHFNDKETSLIELDERLNVLIN